MGKLMSNPTTAAAMMKMANPATPITGALTKPILMGLRGVSGLSIAGENGQSIPVEVNNQGQIVPAGNPGP
jgi:hypothetical protein